FSVLPGLKPGSFAAEILIVAPVCGLRPSRAARSFTAKVPKPTSVTLSPFCNVLVTLAVKASRTRVAVLLVTSADAAIASINSALFTGIAPGGDRGVSISSVLLQRLRQMPSFSNPVRNSRRDGQANCCSSGHSLGEAVHPARRSSSRSSHYCVFFLQTVHGSREAGARQFSQMAANLLAIGAVEQGSRQGLRADMLPQPP